MGDCHDDRLLLHLVALTYAAALTALQACGAQRPVVTTSNAHTASRAVARGRVAVLPVRGAPIVVARREDGASLVIIGSVRAAVRAGHVQFADGQFAAPLVHAYAVRTGWMFITVNGGVFASPSFLGVVRSLGVHASPDTRPTFFRTRGRALWLDPIDGLVSSDGSEAPIAVRTIPTAPILAAAFADDRFGAIALEPGIVLFTRDGGTQWTPVSLGTDAVLDVSLAATHDALAIETSRGSISLRADGSLGPEVSVEPALGDLAAADAAALDVSLTGRFGLPGSLASTVFRSDGTVLALHGDHLDSFARPGATPTHGARQRLPDGCTLYEWGPHVVAQCAAGDDRTIWQLGEAGTFEPLGVLASLRNRRLHYSNDGIHAVTDSPCPRPDGTQTHEGGFCVVRAPDTQTVQSGDAHFRVLAIQDDRVLVERRTPRRSPREVMIYGIDSGVFTPAPYEHAANGSNFHWFPNGTLVYLGQAAPDPTHASADPSPAPSNSESDAEPEPRLEVRMVFPGGATTRRPLPSGTTAISFIDSMRGVATGMNAGDVHRTVDGGEHWTHITVPMLVASDELYSVGERIGGPPVRCNEGGCLVGDRLMLIGWDLEAPVDAVIATPQRSPPEEPNPCSTPGSSCGGAPHSASMVCQEGRASRNPSVSGAQPSDLVRIEAGARARASTGTDGSVQWTWQGHDAHGEYTARATRPTAPWTPPSGAGTNAGWLLRGASRTVAVMEACAPAGEHVACAVFRAVAGGRIDPLEHVPNEGEIVSSLSLDDGSLLLDQVVRAFPHADALRANAQLHRLVVVGPDGNVRAQRVLMLLPGEDPIGAARVDEEPGLVSGSLFHAIDPGSVHEGARVDATESALRVCAGPRSRSATIMVARPGSSRLRSIEDLPSDVHFVLEWSASGACIREGWTWTSAADLGQRTSSGGMHLGARHGRLIGTRDNGSSTAPVNCGSVLLERADSSAGRN